MSGHPVASLQTHMQALASQSEVHNHLTLAHGHTPPANGPQGRKRWASIQTATLRRPTQQASVGGPPA